MESRDYPKRHLENNLRRAGASLFLLSGPELRTKSDEMRLVQQQANFSRLIFCFFSQHRGRCASTCFVSSGISSTLGQTESRPDESESVIPIGIFYAVHVERERECPKKKKCTNSDGFVGFVVKAKVALLTCGDA